MLIKLMENNKKIIVILFFLGVLFIGLRIFKDYGVHADEYRNQHFGEKWIKYISEVIPKGFSTSRVSLSDNHSWFHGPAFELLLNSIVTKLLKFTDSRDVIFARHLLVFLLFYLALYFFYLLCKFYFKNWKMGVLGSLFLILHPRIFSHSFYNSVDIAFLSFYVISVYTLIKWLDKKTYLTAIFHALTCAILIDIRVSGIILPLCTFIFFATDIIMLKKHKEEVIKTIKTVLIYAFLLGILTVLFWPLLWENPIGNFFKTLESSVKFSYSGIPPTTGYNTIKWIIITTPLFYSFCFFLGFLASIKNLLGFSKNHYLKNRTILVAMFLFFVPIIFQIIHKTTLYDGWRHSYFIYPIFLMFSLTGITALFKFIKTKFHGLGYKIINTTLILIIISSLINTVWFMIKYHPHQYIYANTLAGKDMRQAKELFSLDYWGLSYRKALEYILKTDKSKIIKLCVANMPGHLNTNILPPNDRKRLRYVSKIVEADYFLGNYKSKGQYQWIRGDYPDKKEYYSIKINGVKFMVVYKLKE